VREQIAQVPHLPPGHVRKALRRRLVDVPSRFADHFEVADHGIERHLVGRERFERVVSRVAENASDRLDDVVQAERAV
jgi:hypothetical protein